MATVKFSQELRDRIVNNAKAKFSAPLQKAKESAPKDWGPRLYDAIFQQYVDNVALLPLWWTSSTDRITVSHIDDLHVGLSFPLGAARPYPAHMPQQWVEGMPAKRRSYGDDLTLADVPEFAELKAEVLAWKKRIAFVENQQKEFAESVQKVIHAYVTLAPALKAWPPLWELIPDDVKEKHKQIVERKVKEVELDVDLGRMTALASFSKIRGGE
jgi:hypothetical protein